MKKTVLTIFAMTCLLILFMSHGCVQESAVKRQKVFSGSETPFAMNTGDEFVLTLESNPTTGYRWQFADKPDEKIVRLISSEYKAPETKRIGAGGNEIWTFRAEGKGKTAINLIYVRPWEKDTPPAKTTTVMIVVD